LSARTVLAALSGGLRLAVSTWLALRRGRRQARKGLKVFRQTLEQMGIPGDVAEELTDAYAHNLEYLTLRRLIQLASSYR